MSLLLILEHVSMKEGLEEYKKKHGKIHDTSDPEEIDKILTEIDNYQKIYDMSNIVKPLGLGLNLGLGLGLGLDLDLDLGLKKRPSIYLKKYKPKKLKTLLIKRKRPDENKIRLNNSKDKKHSKDKKRMKMLSDESIINDLLSNLNIKKRSRTKSIDLDLEQFLDKIKL